MSREVDQRVVEMQFNNAQFERNTKQSINTIERLKASLNFDGVSNSFAGITKAAKNVNLEPVSDGANEVYYRFKALDVVAGTVLSNITAKAMTLGWTLTKALTIDPMKSGLAEYETQINSVQTILANTQKEGTNLAQVNAALDELNRYADMTIYNFTEMTRNIGTFTAAGVKLDTSVQAIKGIANLAAVSGSTSQQASTAMYQLSQALASGTVKLMDWNSVVTAGMSGQVFQDALKETARVHGVAIDEMIAKEGTFRETLQYGWLTASILTETLSKFTGDLSEEELRAIGYTEEQIAAIIKMGETANDAATKVKTFTQLIGTLKEAVQSGWTQSWEYIIGDFEEAKELWTEISDRLQAVIGQSAEARNALLQGGLQSGLNQFIDQGITDYSDLLTNMLAEIGKAQGAITDEEIEAAGGLAKTFKTGWLNADMLEDTLLQVVREAQSLSAMSDEELATMNVSREKVNQILKSFTELEQKIQDGTLSLDEFIEKINRPSGRENLFRSLLNVMDAVGKVFGTVKGAFDEIFPPMTAETLYKITESIRDLTSNLIISDDTADKLRRTFKGLFSIAKIGVNIISTLARSIGNTVRAIGNLGVIQGAAGQFLEITSAIGDFLSMVEEATRGITKIGDGFGAAASKVGSFREFLVTIGETLQSKFDLPTFELSATGISKTFNTLKNIGVSDRAIGSFSDLIDTFSSNSSSIITKFGAAVSVAFIFISEAVKNMDQIIPSVLEFLISLPEKSKEAFEIFSDGVVDGITKAKKTVLSALEPFESFFELLKTEFNNVTGTDIYRILSLLDIGLLATSITALANTTKVLSKALKNPITKFTDAASDMFNSIGSAADAWKRKQTVQSIQYISVAMLGLAGAFFVFSKIDQTTIVTSVGAIAVTMGILTASLVLLRKTLKTVPATRLVGLATVMISVAGAVTILSDSITSLIAVLKPYGNQSLEQNVASFVSVILGLTTLFVGIGRIASFVNENSFGSLLGLAVVFASFGKSVEMIVDAVALLTKLVQMDLTSVENAVTGLFKIMTSVFVGSAAMSKIGVTSSIGILSFAVAVDMIILAVGGLMALAKLDYEVAEAAVSGIFKVMMAMAVVSAATSAMTIGSGVGLMGVATSLLILEAAIVTFSKVNPTVFAKGIWKVAIAMGGLLGACWALSAASPGILSASAALIVIAASLNVLANAFVILSKIEPDKLNQSMYAFSFMLENISRAIIGIGILAPLVATASAILTALGKSMLVLSVSLMALQFVNPATIVSGLLVVVGMLTLLGGASVAMTTFPMITAGLMVLTDALEALSEVFTSFAKAALMLTLASAALGVLAMFAGPISQAIVGAAPDIGEALIALITMLCNVISATIDPILDTLGVVLISVGEHLGAGIAYLWTYIEPAFNTLMANAQQWLWDHTIGYDWFGIREMISNMGAVWNEDAEAAGAYVAQGYAKAFDEDETVSDAIATFFEKCRYTWLRLWGIASPSKVAAEDGGYVAEGYAQGIRDKSGEVVNAVSDLAVQSKTELDKDVGAYDAGKKIPSDVSKGIEVSASLATNQTMALTEQIGGILEDSELPSKAYALGANINRQLAAGLAATEYLALQNNPVLNQDLLKEQTANAIMAGAPVVNKKSASKIAQETVSEALSGVGEAAGDIWGELGLGDTSLVKGAAQKAADEYADTVGSSLSGSSSGSSGSKKTPAEIIEDKYKDQLEANKTLKEIADAEYELWMTENQNGAEANEILAKNLEHISENIELQTKRVELAQAKYDEIVKTVGADAKEAKEAYTSLLDEKNTLASLKAEQYTDLYDDIINRLSVESDRLNKEYELWGSENPGASDFDKTTREIQNVTDQLSVNAEELKYAEQQYQVLLEEYGESDLRTQEAYNEWLDARIAVQDKQNELLEKQLEQFDNAITAIERQSSLYQAKTDLLASVYDDGDLSTRAEDYVSAVETYGKNSPEALRARYQGSSSAVLGVAVAMRNMADQMKKTSVYMDRYQALLDSGTASAEELAQAQEDILSSQTSFVGFAENLADAFDMDEAGKEITVKLAYAISNNWDTIYGGFKKVWSKIDEKFPELASNLSKTFGDVFSEEGAEIATSLVSTVTNALSGDYGSAIVDGLNTILSFVGSDMGKNIISSLGSVLTEGIPEIGAMLTSLFGSGGGGGILGEIGLAISSLIETIGGSGGLAGIVETIGTALAGIGLSIPELLPLIAIILAVGAAIAFLISNWEEVGEFLSNLIDNIVEFGKNLVEGFVNGIKKAWEGITNFIGGLFGGIIDFVKGIFGINSPSKEFFALGEYIDQGFADGIAASAGSVSKSISDMTSSALTTADMMSSKLASTLSAGGNYSYAIEPVVDLSDLEDSRNWLTSSLSGLNVSNSLDTSRSARLAFDTALRQNQNGKETADSTRADVVAAISTLSDRVVTMGRSIEGMQVVLDSKKLVGGISGQMDSALGVRAARARRGG